MAVEFFDNGFIRYGWNDHGYGLREWHRIFDEARMLGLEMLADEAEGSYDELYAEEEQADAQAITEAQKLLDRAQAAIARGDLQGSTNHLREGKSRICEESRDRFLSCRGGNKMAFTRGLDPLTDPPHCGHGRMVRVAGFSRRSQRYFASFNCPASEPMCSPQWVNADAIINEALRVWRGDLEDV